MRQVAEEKTSVRVISHVLNDRPAIGVAVRFLELFGRRSGKALLQQRADVGVPGDVDDRFMG